MGDFSLVAADFFCPHNNKGPQYLVGLGGSHKSVKMTICKLVYQSGRSLGNNDNREIRQWRRSGGRALADPISPLCIEIETERSALLRPSRSHLTEKETFLLPRLLERRPYDSLTPLSP